MCGNLFLGTHTMNIQFWFKNRCDNTLWHESPPCRTMEIEKAFSLSDLEVASKNFGPDNIFGKGGFIYVYKSCIDEQTLAPSKS
jgi:hypothetical protein